jgi:3-oxoacyl-[acyl-carrier-protein] synthase-3
MLDFLRKKMKIDERRFYMYLSEVGNTVSSTIPIAICEAVKDGSLTTGMKTLLAGFGVGYSWGGCVLILNKNQ